MPLKFRHETLAEVHDLIVAAPVRVKVRATLSAADRQSRQGILVDLLEGQELQDIERDARMEAQAALVGAHRARHLDAVAAVDLDLTLVVLPDHTEGDGALWLDHALQDLVLPVLRMHFQDWDNAREYLGYRVVEHLLLWILLLDAREHILNILFHISQNYPFLSKSKIPIQAYNVTVIAI